MAVVIDAAAGSDVTVRGTKASDVNRFAIHFWLAWAHLGFLPVVTHETVLSVWTMYKWPELLTESLQTLYIFRACHVPCDYLRGLVDSETFKPPHLAPAVVAIKPNVCCVECLPEHKLNPWSLSFLLSFWIIRIPESRKNFLIICQALPELGYWYEKITQLLASSSDIGKNGQLLGQRRFILTVQSAAWMCGPTKVMQNQ